MIFKIRKELFDFENDYSVTTETGELFCKIASLGRGYYIYNKVGSQIAQVTVDKNLATLAIASELGKTPSVNKLMMTSPDSFSFVDNEVDKSDEEYIVNIQGRRNDNFSIWGAPSSYAYDIYNGKEVSASVVPSSENKDYYMIKMSPSGNLLKALMITLGIEFLSLGGKPTKAKK